MSISARQMVGCRSLKESCFNCSHALAVHRQSTAQAAVSKKLQERVTIGGSFVEQLAENVKETSNRTEMRVRHG